MTIVALSQQPIRFAVYTHGLDCGEYLWSECLNQDYDPKPYLEVIRLAALIKTNQTCLHIGFVDAEGTIVIYRNYTQCDNIDSRKLLWTNAEQFTWVEKGYCNLLELLKK